MSLQRRDGSTNSLPHCVVGVDSQGLKKSAALLGSWRDGILGSLSVNSRVQCRG